MFVLFRVIDTLQSVVCRRHTSSPSLPSILPPSLNQQCVVRPSVRPSVRPFVRPSSKVIHSSFVRIPGGIAFEVSKATLHTAHCTLHSAVQVSGAFLNIDTARTREPADADSPPFDILRNAAASTTTTASQRRMLIADAL